MKTNHGHRLLLTLAVMTTVLAITLYIYVQNTISVSRDNVVHVKEFALAEQLNKSRQGILTKIYQSTISNRTNLRKLFLNNDNKVLFIEMIENIGPASGSAVSLLTINDGLPNNTNKKSVFGNAIAHVEITGNWISVMKALYLVENLPINTSINRINLNTSDSVVDSKTVKHNWKLSFYIQTIMLSNANIPR